MSTLAYAALTNARDTATPGTSSKTSPGVGTYIDAFAALVPAEVLTLHGLMISLTTITKKDSAGNDVTLIVPADLHDVQLCFWGLAVLSMILYAGPRLLNKKWDRFDVLRILIPPLAFVGWTMLQKMTAFDAAWPHLQEPGRTLIALFLGVLLGLASVALAYQADQKGV